MASSGCVSAIIRAMSDLTAPWALASQVIYTPLWMLGSQLPEKRSEILFPLVTYVELLNEIKELNDILQCQQASVVKIRWRVLYPPQRRCLDGFFSPNVLVVDRLRLVESLHLKVMHLVVRIVRGRMTARAFPLIKKDGLHQSKRHPD